jgi:hypothetical protein
MLRVFQPPISIISFSDTAHAQAFFIAMWALQIIACRSGFTRCRPAFFVLSQLNAGSSGILMSRIQLLCNGSSDLKPCHIFHP